MSEAPQGLDQFIAEPTPAQSPSSNGAPPGLDEFVQQEQYGTPEEQTKAGVEGFLRGATLGASDVAATNLGISTPEAKRARQEANPGTAVGTNILGNVALLGLTGGIAAPVEAGLGAGLAGRAIGYGIEGAALGAGNAVSDYGLGDPNLNAQKILTHIGMGAAIGGGLGVLSKGIEAIPAMLRSGKVLPEGEEAAQAVIDAPMVSKPKGAPTSLDDMAERVKSAQESGDSVELPQKAVLSDAASRLDLDNAIHPLQLDSLDNQGARDLYKTAMEMPGKEGDAIRGYEAIQKNELVGKTEKAIKDLSPLSEPTSNAVRGGEKAIRAFTDQYQAEKEALTPIFKKLKSIEFEANIDHLPGVIEKFTDAVPGVARMFDTESQDFAIHPYKSSWGIDKATYNAVKEAVEALKENPGSFEDLANIRGGLDQHVDILAQGQAPAQIRALKASMMDYIQDAVQKATPDIEVRQAFKRWAINDQERNVIEKTFGASVGSKEFGAISKIKPEMIGDKIFANTANVKAAKTILEPKQFNEILANWLSEAKAAATDKGAFSSNKFGSFLRRNQDALNEAFLDNPAALQKIKDLTTVMRILPDSASINPSGTAKTLVGTLSKLGALVQHPSEIPGKLFHGVGEALEKREIRQQINESLAGKAESAAKLKTVQGIVEKVNSSVNSSAKSIFTGAPVRSGANAGLNKVASSDYDKNVNRIQELANNPNMLMDHLSKSTDALYQAAPNITQGVHTSIMNAVQFLNSKVPKPVSQMLLSPKWKPSESQKAQFNHYFQSVNDPVSALKQVRDGTLTHQTMEALTAVHPQMLQEMRQKVVENLKPEKAKDLEYGVKLALSKFLGEPLDENMLPQSVISNQATFNAPNLSQQSAPKEGRKTGAGSMKNMKLASRVATQQDREDQDT